MLGHFESFVELVWSYLVKVRATLALVLDTLIHGMFILELSFRLFGVNGLFKGRVEFENSLRVVVELGDHSAGHYVLLPLALVDF